MFRFTDHVDEDEHIGESDHERDAFLAEKVGVATRTLPPYASRTRPLLLTIVTIIIAAITFASGYLTATWANKPSTLPGGLKRAPTQTTQMAFIYNSSFATPPPTDGSVDIWDSMVPNGLGYIKDAEWAPKTSVLSVFHQLHCLYTLRRAYFSQAPESQLEDFDLGKDRSIHVNHCFDYIRQALLCAGDSSIEPGIDEKNGFLGSGFPRQCRNFEALSAWAEDHRAFDAHGFLATGHAEHHG